jgi:hypothetical protein
MEELPESLFLVALMKKNKPHYVTKDVIKDILEMDLFVGVTVQLINLIAQLFVLIPKMLVLKMFKVLLKMSLLLLLLLLKLLPEMLILLKLLKI